MKLTTLLVAVVLSSTAIAPSVADACGTYEPEPPPATERVTGFVDNQELIAAISPGHGETSKILVHVARFARAKKTFYQKSFEVMNDRQVRALRASLEKAKGAEGTRRVVLEKRGGTWRLASWS